MFVSSLIVRAVVEELSRMHLDVAGLLRNASIQEPLTDPSDGVPARDFGQLIRGALEATADPVLGLTLGARAPERSMHVMLHLLFASRTLRDAFGVLRKYSPALSDLWTFELTEHRELGYFGFSCQHPEGDVNRFAAEYALLFSLRIARAISAQRDALREVWFSHRPQTEAYPYEEAFQCCVTFARPLNALVFPREMLDRPLPYADPLLCSLLAGCVDQLLIEPRRHDSFTQRVRRALRYEPDLSHVDFDRLAGRWGVTRRTLNRYLTREGSVVLSDLLTEARFREASRELMRPTETIQGVAQRLGYSEVSSFHRAFKRWTGQTPKSFRDRSLAAG